MMDLWKRDKHSAKEQWEYHVVTDTEAPAVRSAQGLNALGADGWELCGVRVDRYGESTFFFKRQV